jgi:hypothetical protein
MCPSLDEIKETRQCHDGQRKIRIFSYQMMWSAQWPMLVFLVRLETEIIMDIIKKLVSS